MGRVRPSTTLKKPPGETSTSVSSCPLIGRNSQDTDICYLAIRKPGSTSVVTISTRYPALSLSLQRPLMARLGKHQTAGESFSGLRVQNSFRYFVTSLNLL